MREKQTDLTTDEAYDLLSEENRRRVCDAIKSLLAEQEATE